MPAHSEKRRLPHTPEHLFDLVADIDRYPEFLPWCAGAKIRQREGNVLTADMVIGYRMFRERFTSQVTLDRPDRIEVAYRDGPFRDLTNTWRFLPDGQGACVVDFDVDFTFRSAWKEMLIGAVFTQAVHRMVASFEARADVIYGAGEEGPSAPQPAFDPTAR